MNCAIISDLYTIKIKTNEIIKSFKYPSPSNLRSIFSFANVIWIFDEKKLLIDLFWLKFKVYLHVTKNQVLFSSLFLSILNEAENSLHDKLLEYSISFYLLFISNMFSHDIHTGKHRKVLLTKSRKRILNQGLISRKHHLTYQWFP
jgi:hypothetical protein